MNKEKAAELERIISKEYPNTAGIVVLKNGEVFYENYFNGCSADSRLHVYSVTKSIISILIGIAADIGCIKSIDQKVLDYFPDYIVKKGEKTIQQITIKDLLTMTAPYKYKFAPYKKYFMSDNPVKFTLDLLGGRGQIGCFRYAALIGPDILSGILIKATGQSVFDFAAARLFSPLDITVEKSLVFHNKEEQIAFSKANNISGWVADKAGVNTAGWGLTLSAADMAKIGRLCLENGVWNGKQIVSEQWLRESTTEHSRWEKRNLPYGYLWWLPGEHSYAAMGDGGNTIYVDTMHKAVISIASLFIPNARDRIDLIQKHILPLFAD